MPDYPILNGADLLSEKIINLAAGTLDTDGVNLLQVNNAIAAAIAGGVTFIGSYDASTNSPDLEAPAVGSVKKGYLYVVSVAGNFFTEPMEVGDSLISMIDDPSSLGDWIRVEKNKDTETLEKTLIAGNTSGANDIKMNSLQKVLWGSSNSTGNDASNFLVHESTKGHIFKTGIYEGIVGSNNIIIKNTSTGDILKLAPDGRSLVYDNSTFSANLSFPALSANLNYILQNASGTLAFLTDILPSLYEYSQSLGISGTAGGAFITKDTLTTSNLSNGFYEVSYSCESSNSNNNRRVDIQLLVGATVVANINAETTSGGNYQTSAGFKRLVLSGVNNIIIQYRSPAGGTANIRNASISIKQV